MYNVQGTRYNVQYTIYNVHCTFQVKKLLCTADWEVKIIACSGLGKWFVRKNMSYRWSYKTLSKSAAPPNLTFPSFMFTYKLSANVAVQNTFQAICMPRENDKRIEGEHKAWKVICMAKSPGTTDANIRCPSPVHAIPKTSQDLVQFEAKCTYDPLNFVCKLWGGPLIKFKMDGWRTMHFKRAFKWCIAT